MAVLKIRDTNGNFIGIPTIKGDKGDKGQDGAIQYTAGTNIEITEDNVINCTASGTAKSIEWEDIQNKPTNVSDFENDANYITTETVETMIKDGGIVEWTDITNKPTIPSKTSDITNDSDFTTNEYVNKMIQPEMISVGISETITMDNTANIQNVELNNIIDQVGNKFALAKTTGLNNNVMGVKIPKGINKIEINANEQFTNNSTNSSMYFVGYVYNAKADGSGAVMLARGTTPEIGTGGKYVTSVISPILATVEENDVIYLQGYKSVYNGSATIDSGLRTYITIKKVC